MRMRRGARRTRPKVRWKVPETSIPVTSTTLKSRVFSYDIENIFDKWGNGDGDDELLATVGEMVLGSIRGLGYQIDAGWGVHNGQVIRQLHKDGRKNWYNHWADKHAWDPPIFHDIWRTLPADVRRLLLRLRAEGLSLDFYVCLVHGRWGPNPGCPKCLEEFEQEDKFVVLAVPNAPVSDILDAMHPGKLFSLIREGKIKVEASAALLREALIAALQRT